MLIPIGVIYMENNNEPCVLMIQVSSCRWKIETKDGKVLTEDIMIGPVAEAEEYIKRYVTSFSNWKYEMILLKKEEK